MDKTKASELVKSFPVFEGVPPAQLDWFVQHAEVIHFEEGGLVFKKGDAIDHILIILEGSFRIMAVSNNQERELAIKSKGEISGFLPFSRAKIATGMGRVIENTTILALNRSYEREMLEDHYELSQVLVHEMTSRVREFTGFQKQTEKMAALGKLSAGLAHELNNPSSAIVRSARELKRHLHLQPEKFKKVIKLQLSDEIINELNHLIFEKINKPSAAKSLMERKEIEDDLSFLLEELKVEDAFQLAEDLADFGLSEKELMDLAGRIKPDDFGTVLHWIGDNLMIEKMVNDIEVSSEQISTLVNSVKVYTHMDQTHEKIKTDIHIGIRNTLKILNHKIKNSNTEIQLDFSENIPEISLYVSEINQVWTNLIDNAIDAVAEAGKPKIIIKTRKIENELRICVIDNGKGIPPEIGSRIWEPFFTTKDIGKGTGLGLELVKDIVEKHKGTVKMKSQPGNTTFELSLPIN